MRNNPISKHLYSWEKSSEKGRRKPIFLRWWFYIPVGGMVAMLLVGWLAWIYITAKFQQQADAYDLTQMDKMEAASIIYDRQGVELGKIFIQNRHPIPLDKMSPMMPKAVIAAEDNKFYEHGGVDYMGILRAMITNYRRGKTAQGASTVTQQLARNSFGLRERTYKRKLVEMFLAERIEKNFSKNQIMEMYLNRVYFGSGFYGVEAAARGYFGRPAKDLTPGQCAMIAGLLKNPQGLSPWNNKDGAVQTRNFVLKRMQDQGFLTRQQTEEEINTPLLVMKRTNPFKVSYAIDYIRQQAISALGWERAMNGGFRIYTTLDSKIQKAAETAMRDTLYAIEARPGYDHPTFAEYRKAVAPIEDAINRGVMTTKLPEPKYLQGAVVALENNTGAVLAMVGGRDFKHSEYNRATMARRPAGTAFVPFVYAAAYQSGIFPGELVEDACMDNRYVMVGGDTGILGEWGVETANNEYEGNMTTREALAKGKNAAAVRVGMQVGLDAVKKVATDAGIESPLRNYTNSFLGSSEMTLEELTLAYTIFPDGGLRPKRPYIIDRIVAPDGESIFSSTAEKVQAISPEAAFQVNAGLQDALHKGTGAIAFTQYGLKNVPIAGKTGTAYNFTDTYFMGYNSSVTCGVWVGFDRPTEIFRGAFGKDLALPIWTKIMNEASDELPALNFSMPDTLKPVEICRSSGLLATAKCSAAGSGNWPGVYTEYATASQAPKIPCDIHGSGLRNYTRQYESGQWPRPAVAVDLSTVRPVAVGGPALLGLNDVYNSVRPNAPQFDEGIPVKKPILVNQPGDSGGDANAPADPTANAPKAIPVSDNSAQAAPAGEPEVRKPEVVKSLDAPIDAPAIQAPTPEPINF